jgi:hypothetical protein
MAGIQELIRVESDNTISFGNHLMEAKKKVQDFDIAGDIYKVKTYNEVTKLEKNGRLLYESIPGTTVYSFLLSESDVRFSVEGNQDAQITIELEPDQEYRIFIEQIQVGKVKSNLAGKINFSVDFCQGVREVVIKKI